MSLYLGGPDENTETLALVVHESSIEYVPRCKEAPPSTLLLPPLPIALIHITIHISAENEENCCPFVLVSSFLPTRRLPSILPVPCAIGPFTVVWYPLCSNATNVHTSCMYTEIRLQNVCLYHQNGGILNTDVEPNYERRVSQHCPCALPFGEVSCHHPMLYSCMACRR